MPDPGRHTIARTASYEADPDEVGRVLLLYSGGLDTVVGRRRQQGDEHPQPALLGPGCPAPRSRVATLVEIVAERPATRGAGRGGHRRAWPSSRWTAAPSSWLKAA